MDFILYPLFKIVFYYTLVGFLFALVYCKFCQPKEILLEKSPMPKLAINALASIISEQYLWWVAFVYTVLAWAYIIYKECEEAFEIIVNKSKR